MSALSRDVRDDLKDRGIVIADFIRDNFTLTDKNGRPIWGGDSCGCIDDRCIGRFRATCAHKWGRRHARPGRYV